MDVIRTKLLAIHSNLNSFALRFLYLQTHATSYSSRGQLLYTVQEKGGKPDRKPYPLPCGLRNPHRNLMSENSQDYTQKLDIHEFGFCKRTLRQVFICLRPIPTYDWPHMVYLFTQGRGGGGQEPERREMGNINKARLKIPT